MEYKTEKKDLGELTEQLTVEQKKSDHQINETPKRKYKSRLFLGEGNFSYSKSVIKKHIGDKPGLGKFITATELDSRKNLSDSEGASFEETIEFLSSRGVQVEFGIDAKDLTQYNGNRYKRIQFNCPFASNANETSELVSKFFQSAKNLQHDGDRIQMRLKEANNREWNLGRTYQISEASAKAGYKLTKIRKFDTNRYPEYKHRVTTGNNVANEFEGNEFIFEKTNNSYQDIISKCKDVTVQKEVYKMFKEFPDITEDSSSYSDTESEYPSNINKELYNLGEKITDSTAKVGYSSTIQSQLSPKKEAEEAATIRSPSPPTRSQEGFDRVFHQTENSRDFSISTFNPAETSRFMQHLDAALTVIGNNESLFKFAQDYLNSQFEKNAKAQHLPKNPN